MRRIRRPQAAYVARSYVDPRQLALEVATHIKGPGVPTPRAPTLDEFIPRYMEEYVRANRQKPSGIETKWRVFRVHLSSRFGDKPLDEFCDEDIQRLKSELQAKDPKTVNNILSTLNKALKVAVRWKLIAEHPVAVEFLKTELDEVAFYDFQQYARLTREAAKFDARVLGAVLLGGDGGLRRNEIIALSPNDVSLARRTITVRFQDWNGALVSTKGNRTRVVPMTKVLTEAMRDLLQEVGPSAKRVLLNDRGGAVSIQTIRTWVSWAQKEAGLPHLGALHILRHTFCSHLAMRGATMLSIKELAGHRTLRTTARYMHLAPSERTRAIALLDAGRSGTRKDNDKGGSNV